MIRKWPLAPGQHAGVTRIVTEQDIPKRTAYLVFATVLAGVPVTATTVPGDAAPAVAKCLGAPNHQPSEGRHWYYRVDRTSNRRCWYVGPPGAKVRLGKSKPKRHRVLVTKLAAEPAPASRRVGQPIRPIRNAVLIDDPAVVQGAGRLTGQPEVQNVIISAGHSDTARVDSGNASATASTESAHHKASLAARWPNEWTLKGWEQKSVDALAPESTDVVGSQPMLALVAGTIVTAAIIASMMLKYSVRRQREFSRAYAADTSWSRDDSILPILARLKAAEVSGTAEPSNFYQSIAAGVPAAGPQREDVPSPKHGNIDLQYSPDLPQATDEIDLLLREIEVLARRPAA